MRWYAHQINQSINQSIMSSFNTQRTSQYMSRSQTALFGRRAGLKNKLHKAIKERATGGKKVIKTGKPVEVHLEHEAECAICLDVIDPKNSACTPCGHKFCFTCIARNMERSSACPMCRTELQKKKEPERMKLADVRLIVAHNLNAIRSDIMHIMRSESLSDEWLGETLLRSTENVPSEAVSEAEDTERQDPPVVSPPPSTAVSEAGDTEQPSAVPDARAMDSDDDDSDDGSSGIDEYTNEDYDSDSSDYDDPLEEEYVNAVHDLNFASSYNNPDLTERERNIFEAAAHLMLCCTNDVSRWYNDAYHPPMNR